MNFSEIVRNRESCRSFKPTEVEKEKLDRIIETARLSPSACNGQPWFFYVVSSKEMTEKVRESVQEKGMNKFTDGCNAFIVVAEENTVLTSRIGGIIKKHDFPQIDAGIVTAHICYAAEEEGLSTCILGWFDEKKLKGYLDINDKRRIHLVIAVGYREDKPLRIKKRKSKEEICKFV